MCLRRLRPGSQLNSGVSLGAFRLLRVIDRSIDNRHCIDGGNVERVTISPKFQVVIPRSIRERLNLGPGQQVQVIPFEDRIEFIPVRPARELRGSLRGIPTEMPREPDRL